MGVGIIKNPNAVDTDVCAQIANGTVEINSVLKTGNICFISYQITGASISGNQGTICRLPEGFRPKNTVYFRGTVTYAGTNADHNLIMYPDGNIKTNIGSNTVTAVYLRNIAFPLV